MKPFPFEKDDQLYGQVILGHYKKSGNKVRIEGPDIEYDEYNPVCGDRVVLQVKLRDGRIGEASFHGEGCSISQASASMMTDIIGGKTLEQVVGLSGTFRQMMFGHAPLEEEMSELGDLESLQAARKFPVRIKCALLAWTALEEGIAKYQSRSAQ